MSSSLRRKEREKKKLKHVHVSNLWQRWNRNVHKLMTNVKTCCENFMYTHQRVYQSENFAISLAVKREASGNSRKEQTLRMNSSISTCDSGKLFNALMDEKTNHRFSKCQHCVILPESSLESIKNKCFRHKYFFRNLRKSIFHRQSYQMFIAVTQITLKLAKKKHKLFLIHGRD